MRRFWILPIGAALLLSGCPSYSLMHTAKPITPETNEFGVMLVGAGFGFASQDVGGVEIDGASLAGPGVEFQIRHGVNEKMDFGLKYSTTQPFSLTGDLNIGLVNSEGFNLSIDPTISPMYISAGDLTFFSVTLLAPIMADVVSTDSMGLTLSFIPGFQYGSVSGSTTDDSVAVDGIALALGGSIGWKIKLGETFSLMPNFTMLMWFPSEDASTNYYTWVGGLGFLF